VPNVFLEAPLTSGGPWNAARFKNKTYDGLVKQYVAAVDLQTQKTIAGKIENLLLQETPIVIPYFIDGLTATTSTVHGVNPTAISHQLGTDKPVIQQYWTWISHFVTGNPGNSYQYQAPIGPLLTTALGNSLKLAAVAFILVVPLGIIGGVIAALNVGKPIDRM